MSIFLFLVLNRLVDIQDKLYQARGEVKRNSVAPAATTTKEKQK